MSSQEKITEETPKTELSNTGYTNSKLDDATKATKKNENTKTIATKISSRVLKKAKQEEKQKDDAQLENLDVQEFVSELESDEPKSLTAVIKKEKTKLAGKAKSVDLTIVEDFEIQKETKLETTEPNPLFIVETKEVPTKSIVSSVSKTFGEGNTVQMVSDLELIKPEGLHLSSSKVARNVDGVASMTHTIQGISLGNDQQQEIKPLQVRSKDTLQMAEKKKDQSKSVDLAVEILNIEESTLNLDIAKQPEEFVSPKNVATNLVSNVGKVQGENQNVQQCQGFEEEIHIPKEKVSSIKSKDGVKSRAKSIGKTMGYTNQEEVQEDLLYALPSTDTAELIKEENRTEVAQSLGRVHGKTENIEHFIDLRSVVPDTKQAMTPNVEIEGRLNIIANKSINQGANQEQDSCTEFVIDLQRQEENVTPVFEIGKLKDRAKSCDQSIGVENVAETTTDFKIELPETTTNHSFQKNRTQSKAKSIEKEIGYFPEDMYAEEFENHTTTILQTVQPHFVQNTSKDRAKSMERKMGENVPEEVTLEIGAEQSQIQIASTGVQTKKRAKVNHNAVIRGESTREEAADSFKKVDAKQLNVVPVLSKTKKSYTEQAYNIPNVLGLDVEKDSIELMKPQSNESAVAARETEKTLKGRSRCVERTVGSMMKTESCEDLPSITDIKETATVHTSKLARDRHKSVDRSIGEVIAELSADDFNNVPVFVREEAGVTVEPHRTTRNTRTSRVEGYETVVSKTGEMASNQPEFQQAKKTNSNSESRNFAHKRDKSLGFDTSEENLGKLDMKKEKRENISETQVGNMFDKATSSVHIMGLNPEDETTGAIRSDTNKISEFVNIKKETRIKNSPLNNPAVICQGLNDETVSEFHGTDDSLQVKPKKKLSKSQELASLVSFQLGFEPKEESCQQYKEQEVLASSAKPGVSVQKDKTVAIFSSRAAGVSTVFVHFKLHAPTLCFYLFYIHHVVPF